MRFEISELPQPLAALHEKGGKIPCRRGIGILAHRRLEIGEMPGKRPLFQRPDRGIIDVACFREATRQRGFFRLERARQARDGFEREKIEIDRIEEIAVAGMIGAGAVAIPGEKHVQGIEADGGEAAFPRGFHDLPKRGEVADALVALAAQAVSWALTPLAPASRRSGQ